MEFILTDSQKVQIVFLELSFSKSALLNTENPNSIFLKQIKNKGLCFSILCLFITLSQDGLGYDRYCVARQGHWRCKNRWARAPRSVLAQEKCLPLSHFQYNIFS